MFKNTIIPSLLALTIVIASASSVHAYSDTPTRAPTKALVEEPASACHHYIDLETRLVEMELLDLLLEALRFSSFDELLVYITDLGYLDVTEILGELPDTDGIRCVPKIFACCSMDLFIRNQFVPLKNGGLTRAWVEWCRICFVNRGVTDGAWRCICSQVDFSKFHFFS